MATWLRHLDMVGNATDPETLVVAGGVVDNPRWRALAHLTYSSGDVRVTWGTQFMGDSRIAYPNLGWIYFACVSVLSADAFELIEISCAPKSARVFRQSLTVNPRPGSNCRLTPWFVMVQSCSRDGMGRAIQARVKIRHSESIRIKGGRVTVEQLPAHAVATDIPARGAPAPPKRRRKSLIDRIKPWMESSQALVTILGLIIGGVWTYRLFIMQREVHAHATISAKVSQVALTDQVDLLQVVIRIENTGHELISLHHATVRLQQILPIEGCGDRDHCVTDELNTALAAAQRESDRFAWPIAQQRNADWTPAHDIEPGESDLSDFEFVLPRSVQVIRVYGFVPNEAESRSGDDEPGWHVATIYDLRKNESSTEKP